MSTIPKEIIQAAKDYVVKEYDVCLEGRVIPDYKEEELHADNEKSFLAGYQLATDGREELEKYKQEYEDLNRKIESLTPGGSEFYNDPEYCLKFLRENDSQVKSIIRHQKDQITALQSSLKDTTELWKSQMAMNLKLNQELNELNGQNVNLKSSLKEKEKECEGYKKVVGLKNDEITEWKKQIEELKAENERLRASHTRQ